MKTVYRFRITSRKEFIRIFNTLAKRGYVFGKNWRFRKASLALNNMYGCPPSSIVLGMDDECKMVVGNYSNYVYGRGIQVVTLGIREFIKRKLYEA